MWQVPAHTGEFLWFGAHFYGQDMVPILRETQRKESSSWKVEVCSKVCGGV